MKRIDVSNLSKHFTLHLQGGMQLPILDNVNLQVDAGECVVLHAPSGAGKSTLLRCLYANYRASSGSVRIRHEDDWVDIASAPARQIHAVRQSTLGFVTQFLRVIPRISTLDLVTQPLLARAVPGAEARERAARMLSRLGIAPRLWNVPPATFSGGEQQRVNLARTLICDYPILLLDEPTASLDEANRDTVIRMIDERRASGVAIVGIFHDKTLRDALATRLFPIPPLQPVTLVG
ncbi:MAG: phosphonate C-P lyase system protein PhnL [Herminiimonas sp.]|nr:phosphonate C-P lyase system protein PhnL [Herminiimonas sp.]